MSEASTAGELLKAGAERGTIGPGVKGFHPTIARNLEPKVYEFGGLNRNSGAVSLM